MRYKSASIYMIPSKSKVLSNQNVWSLFSSRIFYSPRHDIVTLSNDDQHFCSIVTIVPLEKGPIIKHGSLELPQSLDLVCLQNEKWFYHFAKPQFDTCCTASKTSAFFSNDHSDMLFINLAGKTFLKNRPFPVQIECHFFHYKQF
jgi:hypothetical protein